jgi:hypothetical protein
MWNVAGAAVATVFGTTAFAWALAIAPSSSTTPEWPVWPLAFFGLVGVYMLFAPILRAWPWNNVQSSEPPAAGGGSSLQDLLDDASRYLDALESQRDAVSSRPLRKAKSALMQTAMRAQAEFSVEATTGLELAAVNDPGRARELLERLATERSS